MTNEMTRMRLAGRRLGTFLISTDVIEVNPEAVLAVMSKCIIVRAETLYHSRSIEYTAICEDFDEVPLGMLIPEYDMTVKEEGDFECTKRKITFIKRVAYNTSTGELRRMIDV